MAASAIEDEYRDATLADFPLKEWPKDPPDVVCRFCYGPVTAGAASEENSPASVHYMPAGWDCKQCGIRTPLADTEADLGRFQVVIRPVLAWVRATGAIGGGTYHLELRRRRDVADPRDIFHL